MEKHEMGTIVSPEALSATGTRRDAIRGAGRWGLGLAVASVPVFLASFARSAFANHNATPTSILQFATTLEYLEAEFYNIGMATSGLIPAADRAIFGTIRDHENAHVQFLVNALGTNAPAKPVFDFTAGGTFNPFGDYAQFLALAQAFEDTGVRAYKGGAPVLVGTPFLTPALTIHSVEARHASEVRRLRGNFTEQEPQQGWPTGNNRGTGMPVQTQAVYDAGTNPAVYPDESNTVHATINVTTLGGSQVTNATSYSEAFDEPLDVDAVLRIADFFIVGDADGDGTEF